MKALIAALLIMLALPATAAPRLFGKVNINAAGIEKLILLPGIGPKRAKAIIALRLKRPFRRAVQLRRIRGIGRRTMAKLRPFVAVAGDTDLRRFDGGSR